MNDLWSRLGRWIDLRRVVVISTVNSALLVSTLTILCLRSGDPKGPAYAEGSRESSRDATADPPVPAARAPADAEGGTETRRSPAARSAREAREARARRAGNPTGRPIRRIVVGGGDEGADPADPGADPADANPAAYLEDTPLGPSRP
jgi:hypothetical protein